MQHAVAPNCNEYVIYHNASTCVTKSVDMTALNSNSRMIISVRDFNMAIFDPSTSNLELKPSKATEDQDKDHKSEYNKECIN